MRMYKVEKKYIFFIFIYKMIDITKETCKRNGIGTI